MTSTHLKDPIVEQPEREPEVIDADIKSAVDEASTYLEAIAPGGKPSIIETKEEAVQIEEALQRFASKRAFLDQERKITVTPMNDEVSRINDWYRPALDKLKQLNESAKGMLGQWILKQKREAERLAAESAAKAQAALAANQSTAPAAALMTQSAQATQSIQVQKGAAVSHKPVWKFRIKNAASLSREFLMPDEDAIKKHVAKNGNQNVPDGVEVYEDVSFRVSQKK